MTIYYEIVFRNNNTFYVAESYVEPPSHDYALYTLDKIADIADKIIRGQLVYLSSVPNPLDHLASTSNPPRLCTRTALEVLQEISLKIRGDCPTRTQGIHAAYTRIKKKINRYISRDPVLQLPDAITQKITQFLSPEELLISFSRVSLDARAITAEDLSCRAKKVGYKGHDAAGAAKFLAKSLRKVTNGSPNFEAIPQSKTPLNSKIILAIAVSIVIAFVVLAICMCTLILCPPLWLFIIAYIALCIATGYIMVFFGNAF